MCVDKVNLTPRIGKMGYYVRYCWKRLKTLFLLNIKIITSTPYKYLEEYFLFESNFLILCCFSNAIISLYFKSVWSEFKYIFQIQWSTYLCVNIILDDISSNSSMCLATAMLMLILLGNHVCKTYAYYARFMYFLQNLCILCKIYALYARWHQKIYRRRVVRILRQIYVFYASFIHFTRKIKIISKYCQSEYETRSCKEILYAMAVENI